MINTTLFSSLTEKDKKEAIEQIIAESTPRHDFFLMSVLSVLMAALGILINSTAVVIGSMLVAPLLSPILGVALGVVMADSKLIYRSGITISKSILLCVPAALLIALVGLSQITLEPSGTLPLLATMTPSMSYAVIAFIAGFAASFAMIKPKLNTHLPGTAIAVALIPPLAATGIGIALFDWTLAVGAFVLFIINIACIVFAGMIVFSLMNLYVKRYVAEEAIKKEDAQLEKELEEAKVNGK